MTKTEVISNLMYSLKFRESVNFEADANSFNIFGPLSDGSYVVTGMVYHPEKEYEPYESFHEIYPNKSELRKALRKFNNLIEM